MDSDPHPLIGWAKFLCWQRSASPELRDEELKRLQQGIRLADVIYRHWRPEVRYKITDVDQRQIDEVETSAGWFIEHRGRL